METKPERLFEVDVGQPPVLAAAGLLGPRAGAYETIHPRENPGMSVTGAAIHPLYHLYPPLHTFKSIARSLSPSQVKGHPTF